VDTVSFDIYPAIDLKDGQCVRLEQGDMARATVFNADPAAQARAFADQGFAWLHLVDLDGAFAGQPVNTEAVDTILRAVTIPVQLGGGIRNRTTAEAWLEKGVRRIILGTAALRDPVLVRQLARAHPGRIAVGIDAHAGENDDPGRVAVEGWAADGRMAAADLARRFEDAGVAAIIYTDIARDGMLSGVNVEATARLAQAVSIPVIASGGLRDIGDIEALLPHAAKGVAGVIAGRALYDGRLEARAALELAGGGDDG
jgi:phosphoribosylformimino-5-aminoimidazole carboxamide ribotide isomerase